MTSAEKAPAIIVDLDGTIADASHRNLWDFTGILDDKPIRTNINLVERYADDHAILIVTARSEASRTATTTWLNTYLPQRWDRLFMTPLNCYDPDYVVKGNIFEQHIKDRWDVSFCLEDNPVVADKYWSLGLDVLRTYVNSIGELV